MKKCVPRISDRIITVLAIVFLAAAAVFFFYMPFSEDEATLFFLVAGVVLGGVAIRLGYRTITMGNWGVFYNDEKIVFVLSRKDCREIRWDQLQSVKDKIFYLQPSGSGYFYFPDNKKISISPRMAGFDEFMSTIKEKGFSVAKPFDADRFDNPEELKKILDTVLGKEIAGHFSGENTRSWTWPKKKK